MTLVRPVGLTDANVAEWLTIAAQEVARIPRDILTEACSHARRTCDHHSKIVPAIIAYAEPVIAQRRQLVRASAPHNDPPALPEPDPWVPEPGELDRIKAEVAERLKAK